MLIFVVIDRHNDVVQRGQLRDMLVARAYCIFQFFAATTCFPANKTGVYERLPRNGNETGMHAGCGKQKLSYTP